MQDFTGKRVIVRTSDAGVFYGTLSEHDKMSGVAELTNVRRIWYWAGAASLSQLAIDGVTQPENCLFTVYVPVMQVGGVIEVIPCSDKAIAIIESVKIWTAEDEDKKKSN